MSVSQRVRASLRRFLVKWGLSRGRSEARRLVWSGSKLNRTKSWRNKGEGPSRDELYAILRTTLVWIRVPVDALHGSSSGGGVRSSTSPFGPTKRSSA